MLDFSMIVLRILTLKIGDSLIGYGTLCVRVLLLYRITWPRNRKEEEALNNKQSAYKCAETGIKVVAIKNLFLI